MHGKDAIPRSSQNRKIMQACVISANSPSKNDAFGITCKIP